MIKQKPYKAIPEEYDTFYRRVECIWWNKSAIMKQAVIVASFFPEFLLLTNNIRVIWPWTCFEKIVNDFNISLPLAHSLLSFSLNNILSKPSLIYNVRSFGNKIERCHVLLFRISLTIKARIITIKPYAMGIIDSILFYWSK